MARLSETGNSRRMIYVPPLTPHCKLETMGRNYFSWWAGARLWLKNGANTVYHLPDDSPPRGKLTTRPHRLARAGSQCPFTLINLPVFLFQLYQSDLSEDTQHWSVNTAYCTENTPRGKEATAAGGERLLQFWLKEVVFEMVIIQHQSCLFLNVYTW